MADIIIRNVNYNDAQAIVQIYRPYVEETAVTFELTVPDEKEMLERIKTISAKYPYLVAEKNGEIIGYIYANVFKSRECYRWSVESSIYVKREYTKSGIGKALYRELEKRLVKMGIVNVYASVAYAEIADEYVDNNSKYFHEHIGYTPCAHFKKCANKFGRWYDIVWLEKNIAEHIENPAEPLFEKINI